MDTERMQAQPRIPELLLLGRPEMDQTHREFIDLWRRTVNAEKGQFAIVLAQMLEHTERHFGHEEALMSASSFPAAAEHRADHRRVLGEMSRFAKRAEQGSTAMARCWLKEQIPAWLDAHLRTMDSALAAHLANVERSSP